MSDRVHALRDGRPALIEHAQAMQDCLNDYQRLDKLDIAVEVRLRQALDNIERYREGLGRQLREAVGQVIDGEVNDLTTSVRPTRRSHRRRSRWYWSSARPWRPRPRTRERQRRSRPRIPSRWWCPSQMKISIKRTRGGLNPADGGEARRRAVGLGHLGHHGAGRRQVDSRHPGSGHEVNRADLEPNTGSVDPGRPGRRARTRWSRSRRRRRWSTFWYPTPTPRYKPIQVPPDERPYGNSCGAHQICRRTRLEVR